MERKSKRGVTDVPGMHNMRTLQSRGKRSIPRSYQSTPYVELYMLTKEKERLEKEIWITERRKGVIQRRLKDIEKETQKLKGLEVNKLTEGGRTFRKGVPTLKGRASKEWQRMALHY